MLVNIPSPGVLVRFATFLFIFGGESELESSDICIYILRSIYIYIAVARAKAFFDVSWFWYVCLLFLFF